MTWKIPRSSSAEYLKSRSLGLRKKKHLTQKYEVQYTGNMPRPESSDAKQLINRNMKLHNVSYQRSLSQTMSAFSCIPFILLTIDMSSSSRIEKLLSSYSFESAEWKVLHKKNKSLKKKWKRSFSSFGQFHRIPSILHTLIVCFKRGNLSKSYCGYRSF